MISLRKANKREETDMKKPSKPKTTQRTNPEWTAAMVAEARSAREVLPKIFGARAAAAMLKPRGRPKSPDSKVAISLRLPPETLARWKATGPGWQTRMAEVLRDSVYVQPNHRLDQALRAAQAER